MSSCFSRCLRVPIAMRRFYEQSLWIPQKFLFTNLDLHHGLLSFLLAPAMVRLQHWGLGKTLAALLVVALSFFGLMLISWVGFGQAPKTCRKSQAQTLSLQLEISGFSGRQNQVSWARGRGFQSLERLARGRGLVSCVLPVSTGSRHALRSTDRSPRRMDSRPANRDCCALVRIILLALSTANSCDS